MLSLFTLEELQQEYEKSIKKDPDFSNSGYDYVFKRLMTRLKRLQNKRSKKLFNVTITSFGSKGD